MSALREAATQYLAMRRTLGFKLSAQARILMGFVDYCEQHHLDSITTDGAVAWAMDTPHSTDSLWWARRLMVVRIFARHLHAFDRPRRCHRLTHCPATTAGSRPTCTRQPRSTR